MTSLQRNNLDSCVVNLQKYYGYRGETADLAWCENKIIKPRENKTYFNGILAFVFCCSLFLIVLI